MQTHKLQFDSSLDVDRERYALLYQGFIIGGASTREAKGMVVIRREGQILDAFEDKEKTAGEGEMRILKTDVGIFIMELDQPQMDLLKKYFENTPWTPLVSRKVVHAFDWLSQSQLT